ncbi:hypothetical protein BDD21_4213 [Thiocapsa rosea]|uniref:Uncharacterized protein n=1 Tax=Thiocapsa rosea TaxID=69360 RepID=A0A495VBA6_9GAMM|nr:hypothetical protein BDD21_4213 [Thiocapsa rosea]
MFFLIQRTYFTNSLALRVTPAIVARDAERQGHA